MQTSKKQASGGTTEISVTHNNIINMEFIKEEDEEMGIPDQCGVKDEDTEEKIGLWKLSVCSHIN